MVDTDVLFPVKTSRSGNGHLQGVSDMRLSWYTFLSQNTQKCDFDWYTFLVVFWYIFAVA